MVYIAADLSEQRYSLPHTVYVSPHDGGSEPLLQELLDEAREAAGREADRATADCFLLFPNGSVFEDAAYVRLQYLYERKGQKREQSESRQRKIRCIREKRALAPYSNYL